jgi:putative NIF3 family GTP cyclohydrolase 1 type 2
VVALDRIAAALDARLAVTADERTDDTTGVWRSATGRIQHLGLALEPDAVPPAWLCGESGAVDALLLHRPWGVDDLSLPEGAGVLACHRPFDAALTTGYHPALARALGLGEIEPFEEKDGRPLGMVGAFATPLASDEALRRLVEVLGGLKDVHPPTQPVRGVAVVRAMDERLVGEAHRCGAQLYVTGQMRRPGLDAVARTGIGVAAVGHRRSERFGLRVLAGLLRRRFAALGVRVAESE